MPDFFGGSEHPFPAPISSRVFPLAHGAVRQVGDRLIKQAEIEDLRLLDMGHAVASHFFEYDLTAVQVALVHGDRDRRMLSRYTHLLPE